MPGFTVAGKTGTAAKLVNGRYSGTDYNASFVGFVPSRQPALTIVVVIDSPAHLRSHRRRGGGAGVQADRAGVAALPRRGAHRRRRRRRSSSRGARRARSPSPPPPPTRSVVTLEPGADGRRAAGPPRPGRARRDARAGAARPHGADPGHGRRGGPGPARRFGARARRHLHPRPHATDVRAVGGHGSAAVTLGDLIDTLRPLAAGDAALAALSHGARGGGRHLRLAPRRGRRGVRGAQGPQGRRHLVRRAGDIAGRAAHRGGDAAARRGSRAVDRRDATRGWRWPCSPTASSTIRAAACRWSASPGTNGKTTTAYLLSAMLDAAGLKAGMLGTVAYRIGGEDREASRTTPEAPDVQQLLTRHAGARLPLRGDGGLLARALAQARRRHAVRGRRSSPT